MAEQAPPSLIEALERDELGLLRTVKQLAPEDGVEIVLVIDQFEEVFTIVEDEDRRIHFLDSLRAAVTDARSRLRVVVTLRADFYDRPLRYFGFGDLLRSRVEAVIPLSPDELERAISEPARRVDVRLEGGLVSGMLTDVAAEPGALPLVQYALTELFERRQGSVLTRDVYRSLGGVTGALGRRAGELYGELDAEGNAASRSLSIEEPVEEASTGGWRRRMVDLPVRAGRQRHHPRRDRAGRSRPLAAHVGAVGVGDELLTGLGPVDPVAAPELVVDPAESRSAGGRADRSAYGSPALDILGVERLLDGRIDVRQRTRCPCWPRWLLGPHRATIATCRHAGPS